MTQAATRAGSKVGQLERLEAEARRAAASHVADGRGWTSLFAAAVRTGMLTAYRRARELAKDET